ncbi:hypothetical protein D3C81_1517680 [compost metagenome]
MVHSVPPSAKLIGPDTVQRMPTNDSSVTTELSSPSDSDSAPSVNSRRSSAIRWSGLSVVWVCSMR